MNNFDCENNSLFLPNNLFRLDSLIYFKYFNFFIDSINDLFKAFDIHSHISYVDVLLPVGISFYTFQALSYSLDVYYGKKEPEMHFGIYALYVSFFPQLVAGPIERSTHLLPQFKIPYKFDYERIKKGLLIMAWGFFNKMVIADRLAMLVNQVYNDPHEHSGPELIIATVFFSFQIFCDFSGYSLIAIGIAKVFGYELMENFKRPYFARSISEFWKRWHISLSTWFKDYLYIPLGGNRVSEKRHIINIMLVFIISGLWHGANWTFIIWGFLHGLYYVTGFLFKTLHKGIVQKRPLYSYALINLGSIFLTYLAVLFAWIFFRANSLNDALFIVESSFKVVPYKFSNLDINSLGMDKLDFVLSWMVLAFLISVNLIEGKRNIYDIVLNMNVFVRWIVYIFLTLSILIFGIYGEDNIQEFIYFQF